MLALARELITGISKAMLGYTVVLAVANMGLTVVAWQAVKDCVSRRSLRDYRFVGRSPLSKPVSILVPAYNEGPLIAASVRALMTSQFVNLEVIVINDGSTDETLDTLIREFSLVKVRRVPRANLVTRPVRAVYISPSEESIVVIDKDNGGKADALNTGLCYARYPLVCAIDGDTILDPAALSRLVWEFQAHPDTVAVGGIVRVLNGSEIDGGRIVAIRTPKGLLENIQVVEYLRAFLGGRVGWSRLGMLLIISGAFGLFRRDALIDIGGYDTTTVGEDAELVLRLRRRYYEKHLPCRITFFPDPICWTEVPSTARMLARQRDRWQRGLIETVSRHRRMIANPRYGRVGLVALPYFVVFELFGPGIELVGYVSTAVAGGLGLISPVIMGVIFGLSIGYGLVLSFAALLMEEAAFRRYPGWKCLARLVLAAVVENVGYRQAMSVVRARAWWTVRRHGSWGEMPRVGFSSFSPSSFPLEQSA